MKNISTMVFSRFARRLRWSTAAIRRGGGAKNPHRLREPEQFGAAAIHGSARYFRAEGLDVELIQMNPRLGATAVVNGDVSFATPFTSTFRGVLQGFPMKLVFVHIKKGPYYLMVRPEIKDVQQLKGKKIGVATIKGTDQLVAEEMLQAKGFNISQIQAVAIGDGPVRMQALIGGAVEAVCLAPPHDLMLRKMGYQRACSARRNRPSFRRHADLGPPDQRESTNRPAHAQGSPAGALPYCRESPRRDPDADQMAAPAARCRRTLLRCRAEEH